MRNQTRQQRIFNQLSQLRQQPNLLIIDCEWQNLMREDLWIVWVKGKPETTWAEMLIPVEIVFPAGYPMAPPSISFPKNFLHVHVYEGGQICMPILQPAYWKPKTCMLQLLRRIQGLIHQEINPYSPANHALYSLYKENRQEYDKKMEEQKKQFTKGKDQKYYQMACVHIEYCE